MMTTEFLQGELERLFELESMMALSNELLGLAPTEVGGTDGKGAFARALVRHCEENDALAALHDAIRLSAQGAESGELELPAPRDEELSADSEVSGFRIVKRLERDALGTRYLAERLAPSNGHTECASIKVFRAEFCGRAAASRLLTAARALSQVRDCGLANVFEAGLLEDGRVFVASENVVGQTLAERTSKGGAMRFEELRSVLRTLLRGLGTLHERGILHGLLRAESVLIAAGDDEDGDSYGVLTELVTSRLLEGALTRTPHVLRTVGDPATLAPEVALGKQPDARSEVYSLGCLLYQALTGQPVFEAHTPFELLVSHTQQEPTPPSERAPNMRLPGAVDAVVLRALHKDPSQRYETVLDLADALEGIGRSMFPPSAETELPEHELISATVDFEGDPGDAQKAAALEALVAPAHAWQHVLDTFMKAAENSYDSEIKRQLYFRSARILAHELKDREAAENAYRMVLELDPSDAQAHDAIEQLRRTSKDYEGLASLLLDRLESEPEPSSRARVLREVGELYEDKLDQRESALLAYTQALSEDSEEEATQRAIERLCENSEQWDDVLGTLTDAIESRERPAHSLSLSVIAAGWYEKKLERGDVALALLNRALQVDPAYEPALVALTSLYENAGAHNELAQLLVHRSESAATPALARDLKAQAAQVAYVNLMNVELATQMFTEVLKEDSSHPQALAALEDIYSSLGADEQLAGVLALKVKADRGEERVQTLLKLAELGERDESDLERAAECYQAVLGADEKQQTALDGLVRVYAALEKPAELLLALEQKLKATTTPAQRAAVLVQIAGTNEAMGEVESAVHAYERIIEIAPGHDTANSALARLYRTLSRFDDLAQTLDRHAKATEDTGRKVELLMQAARVLMADLGSPERALFMCERVLSVSPDHSEALGLTSRMRALAGDTASAIDALELMADGEPSDEKRADLWVRVGEMLEQREDLDAAIDRYRLALDGVPDHRAALAALSRLYEKRGDLRGKADLMLRRVELASEPAVRAQRLVELGNFRLEKLEDKGLATDAFASAYELDPNNLPAQLGLGRLSLERGDYELAAELLEPLLEHTTELSNSAAREACVGAGRAFRELGQPNRAERAYMRAKAIAPHDREVLTRLSELAMDGQNYADASELLGTLLERHGSTLPARERAEALVKLGLCCKEQGSFDKASLAITQAAELCPKWAEPLVALSALHETRGNWSALNGTLNARLELTEDNSERFSLLVKLGDINASSLKDRDAAAKAYVAALELNAEDRNVLAKLMAVYSEGKDWSRLVDVLVAHGQRGAGARAQRQVPAHRRFDRQRRAQRTRARGRAVRARAERGANSGGRLPGAHGKPHALGRLDAPGWQLPQLHRARQGRAVERATGSALGQAGRPMRHAPVAHRRGRRRLRAGAGARPRQPRPRRAAGRHLRQAPEPLRRARHRDAREPARAEPLPDRVLQGATPAVHAAQAARRGLGGVPGAARPEHGRARRGDLLQAPPRAGPRHRAASASPRSSGRTTSCTPTRTRC